MLGAGQLETTVVIVSQGIRIPDSREKELTKPKRTTQGLTTSAAETAEMKRGGGL